MKKETMIKVMSVLSIAAMAAITASCVNSQLGGSTTQAAAERDYERLTGTWQLTRAVVNGRPVPASVLRRTILITDHNTFRFPKASGVGTHPAGRFTVNPNTRPKQVDTIAEGGPKGGSTHARYLRDTRSDAQACVLGPDRRPASDRVQVASRKRTDSPVLEENW